ncbi:hypothetical protein BH10ACT2_BH10ACT2_04680 [soil metagenome]
MRFRNRVDAGQQLAVRLSRLSPADLVAVGMPRGGVPVAAEIALALQIPLDVVIVRKLGVPTHRELAMGAIGEDGVRYIDEEIVTAFGITADQIATVERIERVELQRRSSTYRQGAPRVSLNPKTVLVVDDGTATGSSARVACRVVRAYGAHRIVLAIPIASPGWDRALNNEADEFVALAEQDFGAVGELYDNFDATSDAEVIRCLERVREH